MATMFNLLCYVRDDDYKQAFPVNIGKDEDVGTLKEYVKEKKRPLFDHIPADSLVIWKASVPFNQNLKDNVKALGLVVGDSLQPPDIISLDVFRLGLEKRTVHIVVDRPPSATSPSSLLQLFCYARDDDYKQAFRVKIGKDEDVGTLKEYIKEKKRPLFDHIPADSLVLWNQDIPVDEHLKEAVDKLGLVDEKSLSPTTRLSEIFHNQLKNTHIHIVVKNMPIATMTSSTSRNLSQAEDDGVPWIHELHEKLWGRRDLVGWIFRKANLTKDDFVELQDQLQSVNPSRSSTSYVAVDVLATKSQFLRSKSFIDEEAAAYFATCDAATDGNLVPQPNSPEGVTLPKLTMIDIETLDVNSVGTDSMNDAMDIDADPDSSNFSTATDAAYLSEGHTAVFPCTIRYIDLTILELEYFSRVPHMIFIRDEWRTMVDLFNNRQKGIRGGAAFTGQPGIGKTCMLYYILILCVIRAQPILFQDISGRVSYINNEVQDEFTTMAIPGQDILALVDADDRICVPHTRLFKHNIRVLLISSPRTRPDRKWLTQYVGDTDAVFIVKPWSQENLVVAMLFISPIDITFKRLKDAMRICGCNPRECRKASVSPDDLMIARQKIINAITTSTDLSGALRRVATGEPIHFAFEIWPSPNTRAWECGVTRPISDWAFAQMVADLDRRDVDAAYKFYRTIKGTRNSATLGRQLFEIKVHSFFQSITEPRSFTIRSIDNPSTTFHIEFSSTTVHHAFRSEQVFASHLMHSIRNQESCYLKPLSPVFPTFDSFLYQHEMSQYGYQPLIGLQVTTAAAHPISITGLENIQACLKRQVLELNNLRPTSARRWIILFVVPVPMAASFRKQKVKDKDRVAHWDSKTTQYVLELPEEEVLRSLGDYETL